MTSHTKPLAANVPSGGPAQWIADLSPRRQELIRNVFENPREYVLLSVRAAAERLQTDPATIVRTVQRMGFKTYRAFQNYLHDLSIANATSLDGMQSTSATKSDFGETILATMEQDLRNLNSIRTSLDVTRLKGLAKRMHSANRRLLLGGDLAENLVHYMEHHLAVIGLPAFTATTIGRSVHLSRTFGEGDLVIAISFRKGLRQTVEGMRRARQNGAYCVGITGTYVSPVAKFSHECFVAPVESNSFVDSYVAPMALANLILVACANFKRDVSLALLREAAEEQRTGYRWFGEE